MIKRICIAIIFVVLLACIATPLMLSIADATPTDDIIKCYDGGRLIYSGELKTISYDAENPHIIWVENKNDKIVLLVNVACVTENYHEIDD